MRRALPLALVLLATAAWAGPPADVRARVKALEELLDEEDYAGARAELERLRQGQEETESFEFFAGRVAFGEGHYADAVSALELAGVEDRPGSYLRLARDTLAITRDHDRAESEHFILLYPKGKDAVLAPYALEALEAQRAALEKDLGHAPPGKVRVEVVNDASELARVSTLSQKEIDQTGTIAICKFNKLMVTSPKAVLRGYDWLDTLAHEYTHLVVTQTGHNSVPIWLQEALAKYLESRWRGPAGKALPPSSRTLLAERVQKNDLIPFARMHPSMAKLPTWKDAATAFAEVFLAAEYLHKEHGMRSLRTIVEAMGAGASDQQAVERATGKPFASFEKGWMAYLRAQPPPTTRAPATAERPILKGKNTPPEEGKKGREISFGDFDEVENPAARRWAHLGELFRERGRFVAAAEEYGKAHALVGNAYETISNKYALALMAVKRLDEAERVLLSSLEAHPGFAATQVHLGRIYLSRGQWADARAAYRSALAQDPFDPEIHLALLKSAQSLGDGPLADRARSASSILTGVPAERLPELLARLPGPESDPSDVALPRGPAEPPHPPRPAPKKPRANEPTATERL
ncbi:MAG TPA: tetratricopeptide repeat protein [Myxococcaceae bacterium]|nr:tetratricopeptide repeat protein [Myxococcaceae bacterium]